MSFFFGGGSKIKPQYTGLQLQTSSSTLALTIAWGANRFAPNVIWYNDFAAHKQKQKAGKGFGGGAGDTYTYSASVILALCEGIVSNIGKVFKDQDDTTSIAELGMTLFTGTNPQAPWGYVVTKHPDEARGYPDVAYLAVANYDLGSSATLPNHSFEVFSRQYQTSKDGSPDADPAVIIDEFLTNSGFGVGMPSTTISYDTLMSGPDAMTTGDATFQTYCAAMGFGLSPTLSDPTAANDILDNWTKICNTAVVWTGYILKFIPYDLSDIDGNGYKYRPSLDPVYVLTDHDFISTNEDPLIATRTDPSDAYNSLKLTFKDRANDYNDAPVEWKDQGLIDQFTLRPASTYQADEITRADMASKVVAIMGQRQAYIRNSYKFTLGPEYILLEPMDIISAVDPKLGTILLQIKSISESEDDNNLECEAEEISIVTTSSKGFSSSTVIGGGPSTGAPPGPVNPPIIFDVPADLSGGTAQVWAAVSGGDGTTANAKWGGCVVYVSRDDVTYTAIGTIDSPARQGKLTANLAAYASANPDTVDTASISFAMSNGELISVSSDDAEAGETLCYVDGEFMSFTDATLTGSFAYDLDSLYRGLYRTGGLAHLSGTDFARLDENIFKYSLPPEYIGIPLKFKFQSYNIWGLSYEDLSGLVSYDYTPSGLGFMIGDPASCSLAFSARAQADGTNIIRGTVTVGVSAGPYLDHYDVQIATGPAYTNWVDLPSVAAGSTTTSFEPAFVTTNYKARTRAVSSAVGGTPSNWTESAVVGSGSLATIAPSAPTGLSTSGGLLSNMLTWTPGVGGGTPQGYKIFAIHGSTGAFGSAVLISTVQGVTSFTHSGLAASDTWRYWVVAYNFVGDSTENGPVNATTSSSGGGSGSVEIDDEGVSVVAAATKLNFIGSAVSVADAGGGQADVTITGGGGGGSAAASYLVDKTTVGTYTISTGGQASKGNIIKAFADCTIAGLIGSLSAKVIGATYQGFLFEITGVGTTYTLGAEVGRTNTYTAVDVLAQDVPLFFTDPVDLDLTKTYVLLFSRINGTGTTALSIYNAGGTVLDYSNTSVNNLGFSSYTSTAPAAGMTGSTVGTTPTGYKVGLITLGVGEEGGAGSFSAADFTVLGPNTTIFDADGALLLKQTGGTGAQPAFGYAVKPKPVGYLDWKARVATLSSLNNFQAGGLYLRESSTGHGLTTELQYNSFGGGLLYRVDYISASATATQLFSFNPNYEIQYHRIYEDATNYYFQISRCGRVWETVYQEAIGAHITADQVGFHSQPWYESGTARDVHLEIVALPEFGLGTDGISDAPADGVYYGRLNNAWVGVQAYSAILDGYVSGGAPSAFFLTLAPAANAAAARTTLGLGTMALEATSSYVPKTGGTFTGSIASTGSLTTAGSMTNTVLGGATSSLFVQGEGAVNNITSRTTTDATGPLFQIRKARGTIAVPLVVATNDSCGVFNFYGYSGAAYTRVAAITVDCIDPTPSSTAMGGRLSFTVVPSGGISLTEVARMESLTGLSMFGANVVIDQNRIIRLRSYTVAGLPAASVAAGAIVYCSNLGGSTGGEPLFSNGTVWRRLEPGSYATLADGTSAAVNDYTPLTSATTVEWNTARTANRTTNLVAAGAAKGDTFTAICSGGGAFTRTFINGGPGAGTLYTLAASAVGTISFVFNGTDWRLVSPL